MATTSGELEVRKINYTADESAPKYFDTDNPMLTHEWNALAMIIPPGERFFVRAVQRLASHAKDPELQLKIKGFIGQETMHGKETDRFLLPLEKQGIEVQKFEDWFDDFLNWLQRMPYRKLQLAGTAACEHFTAALSIWHFKTGYTDRLPQKIRDLWQWHGAEELEHRAVAFDLLQAVAPRNYFLRMAGFLISTLVNWIGYRKAIRMLYKSEGWTRAQIREQRRKARKIRLPLLSFRIPHMLDYLRPGFHPNDLDDAGIGKKVLADQASRGVV